jgi:hypothetical protein
MSHLLAQQLATLLVIVLVIVAGRHLRRLGGVDDALARLQAELHHRLPVYSAETVRHKEAEFIRDRLPKRFPTAFVVALFVLYAAAAWWLTR